MNIVQLTKTYQFYLYTYRSREMAEKAITGHGFDQFIEHIAACFDDEGFAIDVDNNRLLWPVTLNGRLD